MDAQKWGQWFLTGLTRLQIRFQPLIRKVDWRLIRTSGLVLAFSFVLASSVSTFTANFALNLVTSKLKRDGKGQISPAFTRNSGGTPIVKSVALSLRDTILGRNIFNSDGALAPEADTQKNQRTKDLDFARVPCTDEKLPFDVIGTIYTGDPKKSFVVVREPQIADSDIYKPGDIVIDHEDYEVYLVERQILEIRKGDQKICVAIGGAVKAKSDLSAGGSGSGAIRPENIEVIPFDSNYITEQFQNGGQPILSSAKLIPEMEGGNKFPGFKLIGIVPGSIFDRMHLVNGDIIAEVNGVSLRDPTKGSEVYRALQEEREINVGVVRNGEPISRKVQVK